MYIHTYSINYSITLIIIIIITIIIIHTIQYIYYNYRHTKYDICLHYTVSCEEAIVIYQLLYILHHAILCVYVCPIPLWYMTMNYNLIHYINILYTITIIITIILIYFYFLFLLLLCCCVCVYVLCCVVSLVCMCALLCVLAYAHTCVSVCVYPGSPSWTVLWWRG